MDSYLPVQPPYLEGLSQMVLGVTPHSGHLSTQGGGGGTYALQSEIDVHDKLVCAIFF